MVKDRRIPLLSFTGSNAVSFCRCCKLHKLDYLFDVKSFPNDSYGHAIKCSTRSDTFDWCYSAWQHLFLGAMFKFPYLLFYLLTFPRHFQSCISSCTIFPNISSPAFPSLSFFWIFHICISSFATFSNISVYAAFSRVIFLMLPVLHVHPKNLTSENFWLCIFSEWTVAHSFRICSLPLTAVCLFISQVWLVHILPTHKGMTRLG